MLSDRNICYRALKTRDHRFDGRFFTGVTSTGVYCRPVCPARTPRQENCVFFPHASAAQEAGFRPCLRCRPETSPGTPAWQGSSTTVSRALRLIDTGVLDSSSVDDLASRLGVGARHLRRLFQEHLGTNPLAVEKTRKVHFAKRLLEETNLPILQIALTSGFNNARRFNAAFRQCFERTPGSIRRASRKPGRHAKVNLPASTLPGLTPGSLRLRLSFRPPLAWDAMLAFLAPRAIPGVEVVENGVYRRTFTIGPAGGVLAVSRDPGSDCLILHAPACAAPCLFQVVERIRTCFDLAADPGVIEEQLRGDPDLPWPDHLSGLRVPGAWDRFELAVRAILGQQVTVKGATRLSGRLVERFGTRLHVDDSTSAARLGFLFPTPGRLARSTARSIASVGMPEARGATILHLARAVDSGEPVLEQANSIEEAIDRLTALPGIGDWTAQYIAMRALREPDAFPAGDLGLRKALATGGKPMTTSRLANLSRKWRPWRSYAAMRLWAGGIPDHN